MQWEKKNNLLPDGMDNMQNQDMLRLVVTKFSGKGY